jgi:hypothetical protein
MSEYYDKAIKILERLIKAQWKKRWIRIKKFAIKKLKEDQFNIIAIRDKIEKYADKLSNMDTVVEICEQICKDPYYISLDTNDIEMCYELGDFIWCYMKDESAMIQFKTNELVEKLVNKTSKQT